VSVIAAVIVICGQFLLHFTLRTYNIFISSGWRREIVIRGVQDSGSSSQRCDVYYYSPENKKLVCTVWYELCCYQFFFWFPWLFNYGGFFSR